ncbi:cytochrome b/b6 domain-containing protein [Paracoccus benzoatiresistens]|uniref:Cytochrome b/b6 domain-containing protein n=1 Tax=Paracoccus benzoatiresistens TaxID=2997341 RepID=A0ABT4J3E3_9RHOB|nr:cytochrome b/b6 domain-containing protein [Paracoccus sp. EF6]MCZ0961419.1 cytochrome b/b6 domain-containing protein [Paracoccus sp. EF6]
MAGGPAHRERIWDPALRAFHWTLAILVVANWLLGKIGPSDMTLHFWLGYAVIGLLLFRLVWGFVGPPSARFGQFVRGPRAVLAYAGEMVRPRPSNWPGHSPIGALAVVAMLVVLILQVITGLFADPEDYINVGPLASQVSSATSRAALRWHHRGADLILILVLLHWAVILFYRLWKRENLVDPMITGWKWVRRR